MKLLGKTSLVTGAGSRGIGRDIALALATEGADVSLHARDADRPLLIETRDAIRNMGRRAEIVAADLATPDAARRMVDDAHRLFGRLDILINNAAAIVRRPLFELTDADLDTVLSVNVKAYFAAGQQAARHMVAASRPGRIIMVSSVNQDLVVEGQVAYCTSKGAVRQLARGMALELAPWGITVNIIAPGTIETDINRHLLADKSFRQARLAPIPLARIGTPADIGAAAVFLASDAASYVTGATLTIDGGLSLR